MKKSVKSAILIALAMCLTLSLAACNNNQSNGNQPPAGQEDQQPPASGGTDRDYILIGWPAPLTGALAGFGEATQWSVDRVLSIVNADGGVYIEEAGKKLPIQIKVIDTESNPTKTSEVTSRLILEDKVDMMFALHTPETVNPVSALCERYEIPCIGLDAPIDAWLPGGPYKWTYHSFFTIDMAYIALTNPWKKLGLTEGKVGLLLSNDSDGMAWVDILTTRLTADGYTVVDPGRFTPLTADFTAIINTFKQENVELIIGTNTTPDWSTFWKQTKQQNYKPTFATMGKALLFKSDAMSLGPDLVNGTGVEVWWSPLHTFVSSLNGETAKDVCDAYTADTGRIWTATLGYKYSAIETAYDVLTRAGTLDKEKIRQALEATDLDTMVGHIKYNDEHYSLTPIVSGQWVKDGDDDIKLEIIDNAGYPEVPVTAEILFPMP